MLLHVIVKARRVILKDDRKMGQMTEQLVHTEL